MVRLFSVYHIDDTRKSFSHEGNLETKQTNGMGTLLGSYKSVIMNWGLTFISTKSTEFNFMNY